MHEVGRYFNHDKPTRASLECDRAPSTGLCYKQTPAPLTVARKQLLKVTVTNPLPKIPSAQRLDGRTTHRGICGAFVGYISPWTRATFCTNSTRAASLSATAGRRNLLVGRMQALSRRSMRTLFRRDAVAVAASARNCWWGRVALWGFSRWRNKRTPVWCTGALILHVGRSLWRHRD